MLPNPANGEADFVSASLENAANGDILLSAKAVESEVVDFGMKEKEEVEPKVEPEPKVLGVEEPKLKDGAAGFVSAGFSAATAAGAEVPKERAGAEVEAGDDVPKEKVSGAAVVAD